MISSRALFAFVLLVGAGCEARSDKQVPQSSAHTNHEVERPEVVSASSLTLVTDHSLVCMVNNQFMGQPQIPIDVDGRTYYGCCEMCKGRLANEPSSRAAVDPVSGVTVDKATAVIGRDAAGKVIYFENAQTFNAYVQR